MTIQHIKQGHRNTTLRCKDNGQYGPLVTNNFGASQGSAIIALLFTIYLYDVMKDYRAMSDNLNLPQRTAIQAAAQTHKKTCSRQYAKQITRTKTREQNNQKQITAQKQQSENNMNQKNIHHNARKFNEKMKSYTQMAHTSSQKMTHHRKSSPN